ncbi:alternative oxidase [Crepidotus variabilis]|uniref:Alternative oxidase n=1 Tax=Crepidotus variabilis TaxID=179855 RepID=A0A9P6JRX5_9AGAR|nr:alternative oxidase [Crepidotus variabilis]
MISAAVTKTLAPTFTYRTATLGITLAAGRVPRRLVLKNFRSISTRSSSKSSSAEQLDFAAASSQTDAAKSSNLTKPGPASTLPPKDFRGDWMLFHPVYSPDELTAVKVLHRKPENLGDKVAFGLVMFARKMFDIVVGYKHPKGPPPPNATIDELRKLGYTFSEKQWLIRIFFLETIAGVPGMVAATIRHLQSLRLMRRDNGWIHTLLQEAENERMHLMTFMTLSKPSFFMRFLILGAQGVYYNLFFLSYLMSPRICHRFVGYLEEEAVLTYTRCIADLEAGKIPEWYVDNVPAPEIAIDYWRMPPKSTLLDVLYAVRSDETTHRFVNHSLANLNTSTDVNPFALREPDMHVKGGKIEFTRGEADEYVSQGNNVLDKEKASSKKND